MAHSTVVSSPGKVLIAGGYLVLDPTYSGIVVSASSRFYTVISDGQPTHIQVRSPQFKAATWSYSLSFFPSVQVEQAPEQTSTNKFVHLALKKTLALVAEIKGLSSLQDSLARGLDIAIAGDNDFYSQRARLASLHLPRTITSLEFIEPFAATGVSLSNVHKTGMGSSAALITSLVSALLLHLGAIPPSSFSDLGSDGRRLAHNLAQYVHCLAQGKVGSGFDVSSAVFGSHIYTRFAPDVLNDLMSDDSTSTPLLPVLSPLNDAWNYRVQPFQLPPLTRIMLADVDAGSDTPSLVGKVLKWRNQDSERANTLWTALDQLNQSLAQTLIQISNLYTKDPQSYESAVKYISSLNHFQWLANPDAPPEEMPVISTFYAAHTISESIREKMREMGSLADVPIEPEEQTTLLDTCISQAGVIGGGVPGAGGYDAVWLLVLDPVDPSPDQPPRLRVEHVWETYSTVSPLSTVESLAKGARVEVLEHIKGLKEAVSQKSQA
ncbi:phosphomevalonate kinase [Guyanagaster necrorhizus]|uniref:Phosphomevalonate kinase n=1 Tax=Guyanagaster necrorhizus TaxID=856835 RepID=A0A9P8AVP0_9AGAR|nr:phosphomevalonate kinase [Guyanagaster necrorhizus MCA 3950]KAG7449525.1 phosphomevalonate kinase [Guyanagaster necrorhizus MCA 3950]